MSSAVSREPRTIDGREYDGVIFIHIQKTGGVAISQALEFLLGAPEYGVDTHRRLADFDVDHSRYFKFAVARNPFERCVSWVYWHHKHGATHATLNSAIKGIQPLSFYDIDQMDFVLRFERLQDDFDILCDKLDIPRRRLPKVNASTHGPYQGYFSVAQREWATLKFQGDLRRFGYEF